MASEKTIKTIVKFAAGLKGVDSAVLEGRSGDRAVASPG